MKTTHLAPPARLERATTRLTAECSTDWAKEDYQCRHWSTFPGRHQPSIIDASELNFRVRNGNGCDLCAINTDLMVTRTRIELVLPAWEAGVLTAWPTGRMVHHRGLEPRTHWLRVSCSTNWANGAFTVLLYYITSCDVCQVLFEKTFGLNKESNVRVETQEAKGKALDRLVPTSWTCHHAYTSGLSTS